MGDASSYLRAGIGDLGSVQRRLLKRALTERRDDCVARGDGPLAAVWNGVACVIAEYEDTERLLLARLQGGAHERS